jgi:hypothetical protein
LVFLLPLVVNAYFGEGKYVVMEFLGGSKKFNLLVRKINLIETY